MQGQFGGLGNPPGRDYVTLPPASFAEKLHILGLPCGGALNTRSVIWPEGGGQYFTPTSRGRRQRTPSP